MSKAVFGLVDSESQAERIVDNLKASGFGNNDISVLFPDKTGTRDFAHEKATKAPEGAAAGAGTGTVVGGVLGWLVGIGSLAIPGVGPFIAGRRWCRCRSRRPFRRVDRNGYSRIRSQAIRGKNQTGKHPDFGTLGRQ